MSEKLKNIPKYRYNLLTKIENEKMMVYFLFIIVDIINKKYLHIWSKLAYEKSIDS